MTQVDIARVALGAPALQQVFVISRPECLLIKSWARNERTNTEDAAALIGKLFRDCDDALAASGSGTEARTLMVESNDRVVVVARVTEDVAAAFVFDQSAPLGLIRVQARQLTAQLARTLASDPSRGVGRAPKSSPAAATETGRPAPRTANGQATVNSGGLSAPPSANPPGAPISPSASGSAAPRSSGPAAGTSGGPTSSTRSAPLSSAASGEHATRPSRSPRPTFQEPPLRERSPAFGIPAVPSSSVSGPVDPLASRIADFTRTSADARSALLRLSLRTGLPMELLERPSNLSASQADLVGRALDELQPKKSG